MNLDDLSAQLGKLGLLELYQRTIPTSSIDGDGHVTPDPTDIRCYLWTNYPIVVSLQVKQDSLTAIFDHPLPDDGRPVDDAAAWLSKFHETGVLKRCGSQAPERRQATHFFGLPPSTTATTDELVKSIAAILVLIQADQRLPARFTDLDLRPALCPAPLSPWRHVQGFDPTPLKPVVRGQVVTGS